MEICTTDVLILGGGLSAYMAAYTMLKKRRKEKVMIVAPNRTGEAARALRGMALSRLDGDSAVKYGQDTLKTGAYQNDPALVKVLSEESTAVFDRVRTVVNFDPPEENSRFRPVTGDQNALWKTLADTVEKQAEVKKGCCGLRRFGELYRENADFASLRGAGSGIGLAYYAGTEMADLEFAAFDEDSVTTLGGVVIDSQCHTSIPGLMACGGVTAGVHGAGLIQGNAETAALVFGRRAGHALTRMDFLPGADEETIYKWANETVFIGQKDQSTAYARIRNEIAHTLNASAGEIRTQEKIEDGLKIIAHLQHELNDLDLCPLRQVYEKMELDFALIAARLTLLASLEREESCGCYKRAVIHLVEKRAEEEPVAEEISVEEASAQNDTEESIEPASEENVHEESSNEEQPSAPDDAVAVVCEPPKEPEYEEQIELIEKDVKPYRVTMKLSHMILMPQKEAWNKEA